MPTPKTVFDNKTNNDKLADKPDFKDETLTEDELNDNKTDMDRVYDEPVDDESWQSKVARFGNGEVVNDPHEGTIVFNQQLGNGELKVHGPMPRSEWAEYCAKNGL